MDPNVTIELKIRRRLDNIFNKQPSEFSENRTYDDYLEQKESYVFNLLLGESVAETEAKIAEYTRVNQDSITRNRAAQSGIQSSANANPAVTVAAAAAAAAQPAQPKGYVPTARHNGCSALPVPTVAYTESERGLRVDRAGLQLPTKERVGTASGWSSRAALLRAFNSAKQFWC